MKTKKMPAPKCVVCSTRVPVPMRASLGGLVHSQECAFVLLARIIEAVPGVVELLPPQWRGDVNADAELPETHSKARRERAKASWTSGREPWPWP